MLLDRMASLLEQAFRLPVAPFGKRRGCPTIPGDLLALLPAGFILSASWKAARLAQW